MTTNIETLIEVNLENRNRTTVFWRGILVAPVYIFFATIVGSTDAMAVAALFFAPTLLALLFRGIYPSYFLHINHALTEFEVRITAYLMLLTDDYPSIERNPQIAVIFPDVQGGKSLNRWLPLVKWFLAIPIYIVGIAYIIASGVVTFIAVLPLSPGLLFLNAEYLCAMPTLLRQRWLQQVMQQGVSQQI